MTQRHHRYLSPRNTSIGGPMRCHSLPLCPRLRLARFVRPSPQSPRKRSCVASTIGASVEHTMAYTHPITERIKFLRSRRETLSSRHVDSFFLSSREDIVSMLEKRNFVLPACRYFYTFLIKHTCCCLLYSSDASVELLRPVLGCRPNL